jgi:alanine racemase
MIRRSYETHMDNTFINISRPAIQGNITNLKSLLAENSKFFAVVKANAYGHGVKQVIEVADDLVEGYAVHSLEEAESVKKTGTVKPILIMGYIPVEDLEKPIRNGFHFVIYNHETFTAICEISSKLGIRPLYHIKVETGTGRQGVMEDDIQWYIDSIKKNGIPPAGMSTHFANIEDTTKHSYAMYQLQKFNEITDRFKAAGINIPMRHTACSAAALLFPNSHFDMVRSGISLYGYWPSKETYLSFLQKYPDRTNGFLKPALSWLTRINQIKHMPKSSFVGYGLSYKTTYDSKIAVLPIGYSDGYDRGFSNNAYMLAGGERAPVRGRICMNISMIEVTHIPNLKIEDEVVIIGRQNGDEITADDLASSINTINYEVLSRIGAHIPRYLVD